jgi:hypothetical protein
VNDSAAASSSAARRCHAALAVSSGVAPAPVNIRNELISGGNTAKFIALTSCDADRPRPDKPVVIGDYDGLDRRT